MDIEKPYFMENKEWYVYDDVHGILRVTEKAPRKALESYVEYLRDMADQHHFTFVAEKLISDLRKQGNSNQDIVAGFYLMFCDNDISILDFYCLVKLVGYELTYDFLTMNPTRQKVYGVKDLKSFDLIYKFLINEKIIRIKLDDGEGLESVTWENVPKCYDCKYSNGEMCNYYKMLKIWTDEYLPRCTKYVKETKKNEKMMKENKKRNNSFARKKQEKGLTIEEAKKAIEELREQGYSDEDIVGAFYSMFCNDKLSIEKLEDLVGLLDYELTEEFKQKTPEQQKIDGWEEVDDYEEKENNNYWSFDQDIIKKIDYVSFREERYDLITCKFKRRTIKIKSDGKIFERNKLVDEVDLHAIVRFYNDIYRFVCEQDGVLETTSDYGGSFVVHYFDESKDDILELTTTSKGEILENLFYSFCTNFRRFDIFEEHKNNQHLEKEEVVNVSFPKISNTCKKCLYGNVVNPNNTHCAKYAQKPDEIYYGGAECPHMKLVNDKKR